jgi:lambda repressor-like predicted transcriptional regulator
MLPQIHFYPMNFKTATFREALGKRGMTVARLARAAKMNPTQLRHVLNEKRRGRLTWRRIEDALDYKERALIVELYGPVFGEEPIEVAADETLGKPDLMQDDDFAVPEAPVEEGRRDFGKVALYARR